VEFEDATAEAPSTPRKNAEKKFCADASCDLDDWAGAFRSVMNAAFAVETLANGCRADAVQTAWRRDHFTPCMQLRSLNFYDWPNHRPGRRLGRQRLC